MYQAGPVYQAAPAWNTPVQPVQFILVNGVLRQVTTPDRCTMQVLYNGVLWPII
jgi:hypothetical protein